MDVIVDVELKVSAELTLNIGGVADVAAGIVGRQLPEVDPVPANYPRSIGNQFDARRARRHRRSQPTATKTQFIKSP